MTAIEAVGWTLVHFVWQGSAVGLALGLILWLPRRSTPTTRYGWSLAAFGLMVLLPIATLTRVGLRLDQAPVHAMRSSSPAFDEKETFPAEASGVPTNTDSALALTRLEGAGISTAYPPRGRAIQNPALGPGQRLLRESFPWLVGFWLAGVILLSIRLVGGWGRAQRLLHRGTSGVSPELEQLLHRVAAGMRVSRPVRMVQSALVEVPAVIGWLRPMILLPVSALTGLSIQQLEFLLAHELAHIRRHDYAINLIQSVVETMFFYHPAVWWVSRRIRQEREHCCDDLAVTFCGNRRVYVGTLLRLEQLRTSVSGLAAAATGGNLLERARRLLEGEPSRSEMGPRWIAGLVSLTTVLFVASGIGMASAQRPQQATGLTDQKKGESVRHTKAEFDQRTPASPDTIIRHPDPATAFSARWEWAERVGRDRRAGRYWVGYLLRGESASGGWVYFDRHVPVRAGGDVTMYGHIRIGGPDQLSFSGVELRPLLGDYPGRQLAIFLGYERLNGKPTLTRIHVGNFGLPVHFGGWSLVWLGTASDTESVALIRGLYDPEERTNINRDIVATVGIHTTSSVAVPALMEWLRSDAAEDVRRESAEWLGQHDDSRALAALSRAAWEDPSESVQREAVESMGSSPLAAATDSLIRAARSHPRVSVRKEAVEALGERSEAKAFDALVWIAKEDPSREVVMEAIETLDEFDNAKGVPALIELAQSHPDVDARREAVETLGEAAPLESTVDLLLRIARSDPSTAVRREAVETLGEMKDVPAAKRALRDLIEKHPDPEVQREGVETISEAFEPDEAAELLQHIAQTHPETSVRREAIEGLAQSRGSRSVVILKNIAFGDRDQEAQRAAAEALGQAHPADAAIQALREIVWQHPIPDVARSAVEALSEFEDAKALEVLREIARKHPLSSVQREALEALIEKQR